MEKVYLLLRDNVESGPFSLSELLQMQLLPTDMIWIEGKSTAWCYISELEFQVPSLNQGSPAPSRVIKPRLVVDEIEQKAEEIRRRALSYKPRPVYLQRNPPAIHHESAGSLMLPDEEIELVDHRQVQKKNVNQMVVTGMIVCLFAAGLYAGATYLQTRKEIISPAAIRVTPAEKTVKAKEMPGTPSQPATFIFPETTAADSNSVSEEQFVFQQPVIRKQEEPSGKTDSAIRIEPAPVITSGIADDQAKEIKPDTAARKKSATATVKKESAKNNTENVKDVPEKDSVKKEARKEDSTEDKKKKGLGQTLKNIFSKKDKKKDEEKDQ